MTSLSRAPPSEAGYHRFEREHALSHGNTAYAAARAQRYPSTSQDQLPKETDALKAEYKRRRLVGKKARHDYENRLKWEKEDMKARPELQQEYYKATSDGILPVGHLWLRALAHKGAKAEEK